MHSETLRQCLDGWKKRGLTFCGTGTCHQQYHTLFENKFLGETMLLDLCVSSLREQDSQHNYGHEQAGKPHPSGRSTQLINPTFSGGESDSVRCLANRLPAMRLT